MSVNRPVAASLNELLESSYNLPNATCDIGRVQLDLSELQWVAKSRAPAHGEVDARAHYLLAGSGFNAEQIMSDILSIRFPQSQFKGAGGSIGVEGYLTNKKQDNVFASIDALVKASGRDFESFLNHNLTVDWKTRKQWIYQSLGLASSNQAALVTVPALQEDLKANPLAWNKLRLGKIILGDLPNQLPSPNLLQKSTDFAQVITTLDDELSNGRPFRIAKKLGEVANRYDPGSSPQINEMWDAIELLAAPLYSYRQFGASYYTSAANSAEKVMLNQTIAQKSREFLEQQYRGFIDNEIDSRRQEANLGGVPSSFNKIRAFVSLLYFKNDQWDDRLEVINKTPIWAYLYYLVRAGFVDDALELINERTDIFEYLQTSFASYFREFAQSPTRTLSAHHEELIHSDYITLFRPGAVYDPFKQALYKIIGRCDLQRRSLPQVATTTEDWLWLQLALVREVLSDTELRSDRYTLADLQEVVVITGAQNFDPSNENPGKYFSILLLAGLYEQAVDYLYLSNELYAVHYAIALTFYGLLRPVKNLDTVAKSNAAKNSRAGTDAVPQVLVHNEGTAPELNFAQIIGRYTRLFRQTSPETAVDYLALIAMNSDLDKSNQTIARESLQELVLESRKYAELLGDVTSNGVFKPGRIESRMELLDLKDAREYRYTIAHECAIKADEDGKLLDAILLYYLSQEYNKVLSMVNHALGETLATITLGEPLPTANADVVPGGFLVSDDPVQLARNVVKVLTQRMLLTTVKADLLNTTTSLLRIAEAVDLLAKGEHDKALDVLDKTGIVVLSPDASISSIRDLAQQFPRYDESLARNVPTILQLTLECSIAITKRLTESGNPFAQTFIQQYRQRAGNCMVYAGLIQYRMPRSVYSKLTQLEASLND